MERKNHSLSLLLEFSNKVRLLFLFYQDLSIHWKDSPFFLCIFIVPDISKIQIKCYFFLRCEFNSVLLRASIHSRDQSCYLCKCLFCARNCAKTLGKENEWWIRPFFLPRHSNLFEEKNVETTIVLQSWEG